MTNYRKLKWLWCATCFLSIFTFIQSLFAGENCLVEEKEGICKLIADCPPLLEEIQNAGNPMSIHMRKKLNSINCGFEKDNPIVCCTAQINYNYQVMDTRQQTPELNSDNGNSTINMFGNVVITKNMGPPDVSNHRNINLLPKNCGFSDRDRIYGGQSTNLYELPWMALIAYNSPSGVEFNCGRTIINEWYVLTAAHCVSFLANRLKLAYVVLGEYDTDVNPDCEVIDEDVQCAPSILNVSTAEVIAHPGYSPQNFYDDIALIRMLQRVKLSDSVQPICLPITPDLQLEKLTGLNGEVAGWGATETGLQASKLQSVMVPFLANEDCEKTYRFNISNGQMCVGGVNGKDSCVGDSGGPLMYIGKMKSVGLRQVQRGIVSIGSKHCGIKGRPGMYTSVAYYMDWILENMRE